MCSPAPASYLYWDSKGIIGPLSIAYEGGKGWVTGPGKWGTCDKRNELVVGGLAGVNSPPQCQYAAAKDLMLAQVEHQDYADYLRYGDPVWVTMGPNTLYGADPHTCGWSWWTSPPDSPRHRAQRYGYFASQTKNTGDPVLYGEWFAWMGDVAVKSWVGSPDTSAGCRPFGETSPVYAYSLQSPNGGTPKQALWQCYGTSCVPATSPTGVQSCADCTQTCGHTGNRVPPWSKALFRQFAGASTLPVVGCDGQPIQHTYTVYGSDLADFSLVLVLSPDPSYVTTHVPKRAGTGAWGTQWGFVMLWWDASAATTQITSASGTSQLINNSNAWQQWGSGGAPKPIVVTYTLDGFTLQLGSDSSAAKTFPWSSVGYASGLYANLYGVTGSPISGSAPLRMTVAGQSATALVGGARKQSWWWPALAVCAALVLGLVLLLMWTPRQTFFSRHP